MLTPHDARGMLRAAHRRYRRAQRSAIARASGRFYFGSQLVLCDIRAEDRKRLHQLANECQRRTAQYYRLLHPVLFYADEAAAIDAAAEQALRDVVIKGTIHIPESPAT